MLTHTHTFFSLITNTPKYHLCLQTPKNSNSNNNLKHTLKIQTGSTLEASEIAKTIVARRSHTPPPLATCGFRNPIVNYKTNDSIIRSNVSSSFFLC
jgi:hypothetical protein